MSDYEVESVGVELVASGFSIVSVDGDDAVWPNQEDVVISCIDAGPIEGTVTYGGIEQVVTSWPKTVSGASDITISSVVATGLAGGTHDFVVTKPDISQEFVFEVDIANDGDSFVCNGGNTTGYDAYVDWGDGTESANILSFNQVDLTKTYAKAGSYTIRIRGTFPWIYFNDTASTALITEVYNLGHTGLTSLSNSFNNAANCLKFTAGDCDTTGSDGFYQMFKFHQSTSQPDIRGMLSPASLRFDHMFNGMTQMTSPPLLSELDMTQATTVSSMLRNWAAAGEVDLPIDTWAMPNCTDYSNFLLQTTLTTECYDMVLVAWANNTITADTGINFGYSKYTPGGAAEAARDAINLMISPGVITDGGPTP